MFGEYGYIEKGRLGKPYDIKLLKRLALYALAYKTRILVALVLAVVVTLLDLAAPYLSKIAIDRYILASWYRVDLDGQGEKALEFTRQYGHLVEKNRENDLAVISSLDIKEIDPAQLHMYRSLGIVTTERFYRSMEENPEVTALLETGLPFYEMRDRGILIPYSAIDSMDREDLLKLRARDIHGVFMIGSLFLVLILLSFGISYVEYYTLEYAGQHIMQDIRLELFSRIEHQAIRFFDRHPIGRLVTRVTNDVENLNEMFKSVFVTLLKDFFLLTGILAVLLYLNWRLALVSFLILPFIFGLAFLFSKLARQAFRELRATVARINAFLQERLSGMSAIQLFATEKFQMDAFDRINHKNYLAGMKQIKVFSLFMPLMELLSSLAVALLIWYGGGRVIEEQLSLGALVAFISYIQMFFKPIRDISEKYNIMQAAMASTERIFEFIDHKEIIPEPESPKAPDDVKGELSFQGVSFSYQEGVPVLEDISFDVNPGEMIAVVGATGSGKTTLVNLVERLYDPDKGRVLLDSVDLRQWPKNRLRSHMGFCMQDVFLFSGSLSENITLGRPGIGQKEVVRAAQKVNALSFVEKLPEKLEYEIGERGSTLSGGQRQLLSFARALAADPKILILDEATSSVDPETERLIKRAISEMTAQRTTLVVAHRLSTIRNADRILVMHKGRIVEQGSHETLMSLEGVYYRLNRIREAEE
ncbi:MAG: ABC transporter ATP-binding protein [Desulfatiglans sp.]|jgi:ABC-type multidrug transport system fused ATPase/permease subunit|nr:ABC transporter ATP-binding protein [Desulfatiglans sp.]